MNRRHVSRVHTGLRIHGEPVTLEIVITAAVIVLGMFAALVWLFTTGGPS